MKIGLEFFSYHDQLVDRAVSRVAPIERKSNFAYLQCNQKKIFKMDHCQILSERPKVYIFVHFGTNGLRKFLHESRRRMIPAVMSKFFPLSPENASEQNHEILGVRIFQVLSKMLFLKFVGKIQTLIRHLDSSNKLIYLI